MSNSSLTGPPGSARVAVLEIGSRAARLLVADVDATGMRPVATRSVNCALMPALNAGPAALAEALAQTAEAVDDFRQLARENGVDRVTIFGTEAMRRISASHPDALPPQLREMRLLTPDEEVLYSVLASAHGSGEGQNLTGTVLVIDQGGGSLEVAAVRMGEEVSILASVGLDLGADDLLKRFSAGGADLAAFRASLSETLPAAPFSAGPIDHAIVHGSVATKCAWITVNKQGGEGRYDPRRVNGVEMEVRGLQAMLDLVGRAPHANWDALRPTFDPLNTTGDEMERVVTGAAALARLLGVFGLHRFRVSSLGPRQGMAWTLAQGPAATLPATAV